MPQKIVLDWQVGTSFAWGILGLHLATSWMLESDLDPIIGRYSPREGIVTDALRMRLVDRCLARSDKLHRALEQWPGQRVPVDATVLFALGNGFETWPQSNGSCLSGQKNIGVAAFESGAPGADAFERARVFDTFIVHSHWNAEIMRAGGHRNVRMVHQGVDPSLFHPGPRLGLMPDRFLVFSGGKLERRKGQDLVIAAFKIFAETRPDAMLVTAWHSPFPQLGHSIDETRLLPPVVFRDGRLDVPGWLAACGLRESQFLDVGFVPQAQLAPLLREMDIGVFPNRSEGCTNLVAMECMACGVPIILSANTGQVDLIQDGNCYPLTRQKAVDDINLTVGSTVGWGESDVDEIVACLERAYENREEAREIGRRGAAFMADRTWSRFATGMKEAVLN